MLPIAALSLSEVIGSANVGPRCALNAAVNRVKPTGVKGYYSIASSSCVEMSILMFGLGLGLLISLC